MVNHMITGFMDLLMASYNVCHEIPISRLRLNVQNVNEMKEVFRPKHWRLTRRDLMRLTWTTKYKWEKMERHHERKARSIRAERERPYL